MPSIGKSEDRGAVALCISVNRVRLYIGFILFQKIKNGVSLPGAARGPTSHQCDVIISHQVVADATITAEVLPKFVPIESGDFGG